jgi:anti-sigma factor ChrR (cupin superfamily)
LLDAAPAFPLVEIRDLFQPAEWEDRIPWKPFRPGVEIHRLYGDGTNGPTAALLRFRENTKVPLHLHPGYEHILILRGSQADQNGSVPAGTLRIHPPGSRHSVISESGCLVLAIYEKPVAFVAPPTNAPPSTDR